MIVPAARPASSLQRTIQLSASLDVLLVVLCSKQAKVDQVAQLVSRTPGAKSLVVEISQTWSHPQFPVRTSFPAFLNASADRKSDLSAKRNIGLLLARLHGWSKVAFVDDDITSLTVDNIARLAAKLDTHQAVGMLVPDHPDNSVVCHARRLAGLRQGVFVTGAILGVQCSDLPLSFFPNIYNEDWFFFAKEAAARSLPSVGHARQAPYDPFDSPDRARREEFGDLLAEGLYALIGEDDPTVPFDEHLRGATRTYWSRFIDARREVIAETKTLLWRFVDWDGRNGGAWAALESLTAAQNQYDTITADLCVNFLDAWRQDIGDWQTFSNGLNNVGSAREAMDFLQLETWTRAEYGAAMVESPTRPRGHTSVVGAQLPSLASTGVDSGG